MFDVEVGHQTKVNPCQTLREIEPEIHRLRLGE